MYNGNNISICKPIERDFDEKYVERTELEVQLKKVMMDSLSTKSILFLHGIGGAGKTSLINKLTYDLNNEGFYVHILTIKNIEDLIGSNNLAVFFQKKKLCFGFWLV